MIAPLRSVHVPHNSEIQAGVSIFSNNLQKKESAEDIIVVTNSLDDLDKNVSEIEISD